MKIASLIQKETKRQGKVVNLIASENYPSEAVRSALSSILSTKYAEGYPGRRYYQGNAITDEIESATQELALKVFGVSSKTWHVNVQPYSGSIANLAVYLGVLELGDTVVAMSLGEGGHLTHGHSVSATSKLFTFVHYGVNEKGFIDYDVVRELVKKEKPKLIVCGGSAYSRIVDVKKFRSIADEAGALLMVDMAHIAGLVAGKAHPSPFRYADVVTTTTHKTLRGPRGAMIFSKNISITKQNKEIVLSEAIDRAIFPGLQGGPQLHTIAAIGVALEEALKPSFQKYALQVIKNTKALALELDSLGLDIVSGGTDTHLFLVDMRSLGLNGAQAAEKLESKGIIVNKNAIPHDPQKPSAPSGIRIGTAAITTQGWRERDMKALAKRVKKALIS